MIIKISRIFLIQMKLKLSIFHWFECANSGFHFTITFLFIVFFLVFLRNLYFCSWQKVSALCDVWVGTVPFVHTVPNSWHKRHVFGGTQVQATIVSPGISLWNFPYCDRCFFAVDSYSSRHLSDECTGPRDCAEIDIMLANRTWIYPV